MTELIAMTGDTIAMRPLAKLRRTLVIIIIYDDGDDESEWTGRPCSHQARRVQHGESFLSLSWHPTNRTDDAYGTRDQHVNTE